METVVLVIHLLIAVTLVGVILIQKSEGGGLGIGGGGGLGGMMTARGTANLLTRTTAILAGCFMLTSVTLAIMAGHHNTPVSIIDTVPAADTKPATPAESVPAAPGAAPAKPSGAPAAPAGAPAAPATPAGAPAAPAPASSAPAVPAAPPSPPAPAQPAPPVSQ